MEPLKDPIGDRVKADIEAPPALPLSNEILFPGGLEPRLKGSGSRSKARTLPDWAALRAHFHKEGRVSKEAAHKILGDAIAVLR